MFVMLTIAASGFGSIRSTENPRPTSSHGWFHNYNFGSLEAARLRWRAAIRAGVDFVAVDQYEDFAAELRGSKPTN